MADTDNLTDRDNLMDEVTSAVSDAQDLLQQANTATAERARELRSQVEQKLLRAKLRMQELQGQAMDRTRAAARATDQYVRENPWQILGAAALVGLVLGMVLMNRDDD